MILLQVMLFIFPLMGLAPEMPEAVLAAGDQVNMNIAQAVAATAEYKPAWETEVLEVLADDPQYAQRMVNALRSTANSSGLDPAMLWSVAYTETHGEHWNENGKVKRGGSGEIGLMQILPSWKKSLKRVYGMDIDLYDLEDNMLAASVILQRGGDDPKIMLSYYNTGQRLRTSRYQRAVMSYWKGIEPQVQASPTPLGIKDSH